MILPSKLVNERIMFTIDYGDRLAWGSVITQARIIVEVFSGVDTSPQQVFAQVYAIEGTNVTYQVQLGLPGVIYTLIIAVEVLSTWTYYEVKLAVLPDLSDAEATRVTDALYPLTRVLTSLPYVQFVKEETNLSVVPTGGLMLVLLYLHTVQPDKVDIQIVPTGGDLFVKPLPYVIDKVNLSILPTNGALLIPPLRYLFDKTDLSIVPTNGALKLALKANQDPDDVNVSIVPTNGALYIP